MNNFNNRKLMLILTIFFMTCSIVMGKTYEIYSTKNYHNQLRLNTATGEIIQIQNDGQRWTISKGIELSGKMD